MGGMGSQLCHQCGITTGDMLKVQRIASSAGTSSNDGLNCVNVANPLPNLGDPPSAPPSPPPPSPPPPSPPPVLAWDCTTYPLPVQIILGSSDTYYRTMQLDIEAKNFVEIWQWTINTDEHPTTSMNAQAYSVNDGLAYGIFSPDLYGESYLCRFSHVQNSAVCLCRSTAGWGFTATITRDDTYYLGIEGGKQIWKVPSVSSIAYPPSGTVYSALGDCTAMSQVQQGRGTGGPVDVSNAGLSESYMESAYGIASSCGSCYMKVWGSDGSGMTTWLPGGQNFADYIDFEYSNITYLIGLGAYDGSVAIIKLTGDGGGDVAGYAYSRVVVDYGGTTSSTRTMAGFGAG